MKSWWLHQLSPQHYLCFSTIVKEIKSNSKENLKDRTNLNYFHYVKFLSNANDAHALFLHGS